MFRNLRAFVLTEPLDRRGDELNQLLKDKELRPCQPFEASTTGWMPLGAAADQWFVLEAGDHLFFRLGFEDKLLPASVVSRVAAEKIEALEKEQGHKLSRREVRTITEQTRAELLPQALAKRSELFGWIDQKQNLLMVDTASSTKADTFTHKLRDTLGSLAITPLETSPSLTAQMTGWLRNQAPPASFALDAHCVLSVPDNPRGHVAYAEHDLSGRDVAGHLGQGKVCTKLALTWKDRVSLVLTDDAVLHKLSLLELATQDAAPGDAGAHDDDGESITETEQLKADLLVMTSDLAPMLRDLRASIAGEASPAGE